MQQTTAPHRPNSMTHHCTAARAPQEPCWQEFQPAWIHHMPSPNHSDIGTTKATHHVLLAGTSANNTPSSLLARTPASTRFITEKAPVSQQELQPVQNSSLIPAGKNFHQQYLPAAPERSIRWLARTLSSTTTHGFTTAPEAPEATLRCIDAPKPAEPSATSQKP